MARPMLFRLARSADSGVKVVIECSTPGAKVYYTTDGTEPSSSTGTLYTDPFPITSNITCKAIACKEGFLDSDIATVEIEIYDYKVMTPVISAVAG